MDGNTAWNTSRDIFLLTDDPAGPYHDLRDGSISESDTRDLLGNPPTPIDGAALSGADCAIALFRHFNHFLPKALWRTDPHVLVNLSWKTFKSKSPAHHPAAMVQLLRTWCDSTTSFEQIMARDDTIRTFWARPQLLATTAEMVSHPNDPPQFGTTHFPLHLVDPSLVQSVRDQLITIKDYETGAIPLQIRSDFAIPRTWDGTQRRGKLLLNYPQVFRVVYHRQANTHVPAGWVRSLEMPASREVGVDPLLAPWGEWVRYVLIAVVRHRRRGVQGSTDGIRLYHPYDREREKGREKERETG